MNEKETRDEYVAPEVVDYGELRELTAGTSTGFTTDVPIGFHTPSHNVFTLP